MDSLIGKTAMVTGASKGIGRGIAEGLGEKGATVIVTGRTISSGKSDDEAGIDVTAKRVTQMGGNGIPILCDHQSDQQVDALFRSITEDIGSVDVLVNNATAVPDLATLFSDTPFWKVDSQLWDDLFKVGLRSHFVSSKYAVPAMIKKKQGLIVNISSAGAANRIGAVLPYGVVKNALDRMTSDMASELAEYNVTVISLWPPPSSTPGMLQDESNLQNPSEMSLPLVTGRVIAQLATDPEAKRWTGQALRVRDLAEIYGVADLRYSK